MRPTEIISPSALPKFERRDSIFSGVLSRCASKAATFHCDLPALLYMADKLRVDIYPITWAAALGSLGRGATGQVHQSLVNLQTNFAFKRSLPSNGQSDEERYKSIISEILILKIDAVRAHPNIVDLIGLGWDVNWSKDRVWPVLMFPKATFGNLEDYLKSPEGRASSLEEKIRLCRNVVSGLSCMHTCNILHGDLKPTNVVVTNDAQGRPKAELIDFGYSCFGSTDEDLVWLPFSPPWTAPEHEWREYALSAGKCMDIYSLGMTVAYLMFQPRWQLISQRVGGDGAGSYTDGAENGADVVSHVMPCEMISVVDIIKDVVRGTDVDLSMIPPGISKFLELTLASEPKDRETDLIVLATLLGETSINRHGNSPSRLSVSSCAYIASSIEEPRRYVNMQAVLADVPHGVPTLHRTLWSFEYLHFLVREKIFAALKKRANNLSTCAECACFAAISVAYCYKIGFGVERDAQKADDWGEDIRARLDHLPDPGVIFSRIQADVEAVDCECVEGPAALSLEGLIAAGFLDFNLADHLLQDVPIDVAIQKVEAEGAARAVAFGDDQDNSLYYKLLLSVLHTRNGNADKARELQMFVYDVGRDMEPDHPNLRVVSELLVDTLRQNGDLSKAKTIQANLVRDTREAHGMAHPESFRTVADLARLLADDGEYDLAERYQRDALEGLKNLYGEVHHVTVEAMASLVSIYRDAGKLEEAESLARFSLSHSELVSGPTHIRTLAIREKLGVIAYDREQYKEAGRHLKLVFEEYQMKLGMREERTLVAASALAALYMKENRDLEAEGLIESVIRHNANTLGPNSRLVISNRGNLAVLKERRGDLAGAEALYLELVQSIKDNHGNSHIELITPQSNLASHYLGRGDLEAAALWQGRALELATRFLSPPHVKLATVQENTAEVWIQLKRYEEAQTLLCQAVSQRESMLGPETASTKDSKARLGEAKRLAEIHGAARD